MTAETQQEYSTIEEYENEVINDLAADIQKELGFSPPIEQLRRYEKRKNRRIIRYCTLLSGTDFTHSNRVGFRTIEISSEPNAYWATMYNSLDLFCRRKIVFGVAEDGNSTATFTDEEIIMSIKLEDGTRKRIRIVTTYNIVEKTTTSVFSELEIEA